jgi:hypothetical protein
MILKYNEFINERKDISEICQGDNLSLYQWDSMLTKYIDFDRMFTIDNISDSTLNRMIGKSYPEDCEIDIDDLRYLIIPHYDGNGYIKIGELVCNKDVADEFIYLFKELFKNKYPIERMVLVDEYDGDDKKSMAANNTSAFNYRVISDTDKLSRHAYGMAIDINPLYNPYVKGEYVSPETGKQFVDRNKSFKYKIDSNDLTYQILHNKFGFAWGGDWENCKDYQHYEK